MYILEILCFLKKYKGDIQQYNTALYEKSVINMGIKLYNKLPIRIKQLDTYKSFKKEVKTFLVHNAVYTIEESYALWVMTCSRI